MPCLDAFGNTTCFTLFARWPNEVRLFSIEWEMIQTAAEALAALKQNERVLLVLRHNPDPPRRDVSEDLARLWLDELLESGFDPDRGVLAAFIQQHLSGDDIAAAR